MTRPAIRLRATRAAPPGHAAKAEERRALFSAALQQAEDLFDAARAVGPFARPIPLFYAMSQAGRAVAAAWNQDKWQVSGHGLTQDRGAQEWRAGGIGKFRIKPQETKGVFGAVADALGAQALTGGAEVGALWSALPSQDPPFRCAWPLAMPVWPHVYMEGQEFLARLGAAHRGYVYLRNQAPDLDARTILELLKKYPAAQGAALEVPQGILQQGSTPWGLGPALKWPQPPPNLTPEGIPSAEWLASHVTSRVPRYRYGREHWLCACCRRWERRPPTASCSGGH